MSTHTGGALLAAVVVELATFDPYHPGPWLPLPADAGGPCWPRGRAVVHRYRSTLPAAPWQR